MAFLASAGCNSGESGKIVLGPSPKISLQPYYAGKVSRVEFHLPHAAGRWGSGGSLQIFGPLPSKTASFDRSLQIFGPLPSVCLFQDNTPGPIRWVTAAASGALSRSPGERRAVAAEPACCEAAVPAHERVISAYYILT